MDRNLTIFNNNYDTGRLIANSFRNKALTAKHTALLRLLYTVGGDLASPRTEAKSTFFFEGGGEAGRATGCTTLNLATLKTYQKSEKSHLSILTTT